ncbi:hypothetical protein L7G72_12760 [Xenorhabdus bovienii]|uniref:hypothetical protein n=1 Tax=Xenorhabdus bovienii TaxID=40576 RepID=UPI001EE080F6|nr:hypothetical protein [Xenorhabdus bovienii]MCG3462711.1 hypothetical protein [Xenorhabdus bovienii]
MDIDIKCGEISSVVAYSHYSGSPLAIKVTLKNADLEGSISTSDIISEYTASTLLYAIDDDEIIEHLAMRGYKVTEE